MGLVLSREKKEEERVRLQVVNLQVLQEEVTDKKITVLKSKGRDLGWTLGKLPKVVKAQIA